MAISKNVNLVQNEIEQMNMQSTPTTITPVPTLRQTNTTTNGRLKIEVYASEGAIPVENARVQVLEGSKVINELRVNESGETAMFEIECPNVELTEEAQQIEMPYKDLNLIVTARGYDNVNIGGVQVFGNSTAIQQVNMSPRSDITNILIPGHTLWANYPSKIPESPVKPIPDATGYQVLDEPVIPAYVVVHTGSPSATADNLWIPFKDYIKNVASSEIYSTWPRETIKANVLAIISFVLNRVFTEWYRGKGYNFTITNSTAFDQAFSYGRTIYSEISIVVDEIFSYFVTRPNIRQPLFTQFCDGQKTTCPGWLSQWGSKSLGDRGYTYLNILKYYYGSDIFLAQAQKVNGVPFSWPGYNVQMGSRGNEVKVIQQELNAISKNFPAIPKVSVDGIFGAKTRESVMKFQSIFDLPANGIVDYPTWYKLSNIYVAVTKMS